MNLKLPNRNGQNEVEEIEITQPIVIVGANGSGKSRLGYFINQKNLPDVHRISAQRNIQLPRELPERWTLDRSENAYKTFRPDAFFQPVNDYEVILQILFAQEAKRDREYVEAVKSVNSDQMLSVPESAIEKLIEIWQEILPQRKIEFSDNKVIVKFDETNYLGNEMSDGERVALYLLGQCLVAPANYILVIDEPEIHLHKSLMNSIWNKIEEARTDCQFIYITHDLDFAASRTNAKKIWAKEFLGDGRWIWEEVPDVEEIPENLLLEIIGSRKPILFVEGVKGSYDYEIYQYVFPEFTIIPREGYSKVIESTKALRTNSNLHHNDAQGLIDRDYRSEEEITALTTAGIAVTTVAFIENLLCVPDILQIIAEHQILDSGEIIQKFTKYVISELREGFEREASRRSAEEINFRLNAFNQKAIGKHNLKQAVTDLTDSIDINEIYDKNAELYQKIIDTNDLEKALKYYKNKGLLKNASRFFGLNSGEYSNLIVRLLRTEKKSLIVAVLKRYIPEIESSSVPNGT